MLIANYCFVLFRLVNTCTKIIQTRPDPNASPLTQQDELKLRQKSILCHALILKSMHEWSKKPMLAPNSIESPTNATTNLDEDQGMDASQFEEWKHRKQVIAEGIRLFNWKIKKVCVVKFIHLQTSFFLYIGNDIFHEIQVYCR